MAGRATFLTKAMQRLSESLLVEHVDLRAALSTLRAIAAAVQRGEEFPTEDCATLLRFFREFLVGVHFAKEGEHLLPAIAMHGDDEAAELAGAVLRAQEDARSLLHSLVLFWEPVGPLTAAERDGFCATASAFANCIERGIELEESRLFDLAQQVPVDDRLDWPAHFAVIEASRRSLDDWRLDLAALTQRWAARDRGPTA